MGSSSDQQFCCTPVLYSTKEYRVLVVGFELFIILEHHSSDTFVSFVQRNNEYFASLQCLKLVFFLCLRIEFFVYVILHYEISKPKSTFVMDFAVILPNIESIGYSREMCT